MSLYCLECRPILYGLTEKYPAIYVSISDKNLVENLYDIFDKVGFSARFHTNQESKVLVPNLSHWLKKTISS